MRYISTALITALSLALYAQSARAEQPIDLSWMGQSLETVRARHPDTQWSRDESSFENLQEMNVAGLYAFSGMPFDVHVTEAHGQIAAIWLTRHLTTTNAAACQAEGLAFVRALEPQFGAFGWNARTIEGAEFLVQTASGSMAMVSGWRRPGGALRAVTPEHFADRSTNGFGLRTRKRIDTEVGVLDVFVKADFYDNCQIRLEIERAFDSE